MAFHILKRERAQMRLKELQGRHKANNLPLSITDNISVLNSEM